jgi:hypothetical protein
MLNLRFALVLLRASPARGRADFAVMMRRRPSSRCVRQAPRRAAGRAGQVWCTAFKRGLQHSAQLRLRMVLPHSQPDKNQSAGLSAWRQA